MTSIKEKLAQTAFEVGAIKLSPRDPFTWTSGYRMPIYNDNRKLLASPAARSLVADGFIELIESNKLEAEIIAGIATGAVPHATTLADRLKLPLSYVREKPKTHGAKRRVEGADIAGKQVLLIEDLISTGGSSIEAVKAVREEGGRLTHCLSIFTYGFPQAIETFQAESAIALSILNLELLLRVASELRTLSSAEAELLNKWQLDPFNWGEKHGFPKVEK